MRLAQLILRGAAAAGVASFAAACVVAPPGTVPRPFEGSESAPDVAFAPFDQPGTTAGSPLVAYSVTRSAYAAVFELDQRGRLRVLSTGEDGRVESGRSYLIAPSLTSTDRDLILGARDYDRVPYLFAITADVPLDLSAVFGGGRRSLQLSSTDPDSVIQAIAARVLPPEVDYGSDYAYVGPRLQASEATFTAGCARPLDDVHDYAYFRDLWAVFTPGDTRLGYSTGWFFAPTFGWSSFSSYGFLPIAAYRARLATAAFYGGCSSGAASYALRYAGLYGSPYGGYGYGAYARGLGDYFPGSWGNRTGPAVASGSGGTVNWPPLRIPRTPTTLATTQVTGDGATGPQNAPTPRLALPGRRVNADGSPTLAAFAWHGLGNGRLPAEPQRVVRPGGGSAQAGESRPPAFRPAFAPAFGGGGAEGRYPGRAQPSAGGFEHSRPAGGDFGRSSGSAVGGPTGGVSRPYGGGSAGASSGGSPAAAAPSAPPAPVAPAAGGGTAPAPPQ